MLIQHTIFAPQNMPKYKDLATTTTITNNKYVFVCIHKKPEPK